MNTPDPTSDPMPTPEATNATSPPGGDAAAERGVEPPAAIDLAAEMVRLEDAAREANERCLRLHAELENFRKRSRRELEDEKRYAALPLVRDVLNVLDNLQRAIEAAERSQSGAGLLEGVRMVSQQLSATLEQHACKVIAAGQQPFDPNWHEAIGQMPSADVPAGHVALVARPGYTLHDRVVRPAQVLVSTGPS